MQRLGTDQHCLTARVTRRQSRQPNTAQCQSQARHQQKHLPYTKVVIEKLSKTWWPPGWTRLAPGTYLVLSPRPWVNRWRWQQVWRHRSRRAAASAAGSVHAVPSASARCATTRMRAVSSPSPIDFTPITNAAHSNPRRWGASDFLKKLSQLRPASKRLPRGAQPID